MDEMEGKLRVAIRDLLIYWHYRPCGLKDPPTF
jgi:hypothetical protein